MWITYYHTYAASEYFVNTSINSIDAIIATNYQKYVNDRLNHSVGSTYAHIKNKIGQSHHEDDLKKKGLN